MKQVANLPLFFGRRYPALAKAQTSTRVIVPGCTRIYVVFLMPSELDMQTFLQLNRHKLLPACLQAIALFWLVFCLPLIVYALVDSLLETEFLVYLHIAFVLIVPVIALLGSYLEWTLKSRVRRKALSRAPFNQLSDLGFEPKVIYALSKWRFSEEILERRVGDFIVQVDVMRGAPNTIRFEALVERKSFTKTEFSRLKCQFRQYQIFFSFGELVKVYDVKKVQLTFEQLQADLLHFVALLHQKGLTPREVEA